MEPPLDKTRSYTAVYQVNILCVTLYVTTILGNNFRDENTMYRDKNCRKTGTKTQMRCCVLVNILSCFKIANVSTIFINKKTAI